MLTINHHHGHRRIATTGLALLCVAGLGACGGSSSGGTTATPTAAGSSPTAAAAPNTLNVVADDYSYDISGAPQAGLVDITFANHGKYAHEMGVTLLRSGVTLDQLKKALASKNGERAASKMVVNPDAEYPVPSILAAGESVEVDAPMPAGHYAVICFLPGPDGKPHVAMGMISEFTIAAGHASSQPPATDGVVTLTDSGIKLPANFASGGTFAVTNAGTKEHDLSIARLKAARTLGQLFQCVAGSFGKNTPIDRCPGQLAGGLDGLSPGQTAYLTVHLTPGHYGYVSTGGNGTDFKAGLHGEFTVG